MTKLSADVIQPVEIFSILFMIFVSWTRNQYRDADSGSLWAFRGMIAIFFLSLIDSLVYMLSPHYKFPQVSAFCRPIMVLLVFR